MNLDEKRDQLQHAMRLVMATLNETHYETDSRQMSLSYMLTCRIAEVCSAAWVLLIKRHYNSVPILLRTAIEAYVDLVNIIEDPEYYKVLITAYADQENKLYKRASRDNPYSLKVYEQPTFDDDKKNANTLYEEYKSLKSVTMSLERFQRAGAEDWYGTVYNKLCRYTHNTIDALECGHVTREGDKKTIHLFKKVTDNYLHFLIDSTASILIYSVINFFDKAELKDTRIIMAESTLKKMRIGGRPTQSDTIDN